MRERYAFRRANPHELRAFRLSPAVRIRRATHGVMRRIDADAREISGAKIVVRAARGKEKRATKFVARCIVPKC